MSDFPAGWYDDGSGTQRWWDGDGWTEDVLNSPSRSGWGQRARLGDALHEFGDRITARRDPRGDADAVWGSVGRPLAGVGGGSYKLTYDHLVIETGLLSTERQQARVQDILEVSSSQSVSQKIRDVGSIIVRARTAKGHETFTLEDVPDFRQGAALIGKAAYGALKGGRPQNQPPRKGGGAGDHSRSRQRPHTSHQQAGHHAAAMGLNTELLRLAQLHAEGVLTDQEFSAAKRKMLDL